MSDRSTLAEVVAHYPDFLSFLNQRYGIHTRENEMNEVLHDFVEQRGLPPARIVFMESQLAARMKTVAAISPDQAKQLLDREPQIQVLDVREAWERKAGSLPKAVALDGARWKEITELWPRETPVLVYCHFGVRSLDAALSLSERGFTRIFTLQGGIDAWSQQIDNAIPRYSGSYC